MYYYSIDPLVTIDTVGDLFVFYCIGLFICGLIISITVNNIISGALFFVLFSVYFYYTESDKGCYRKYENEKVDAEFVDFVAGKTSPYGKFKVDDKVVIISVRSGYPIDNKVTLYRNKDIENKGECK